MTSSKSEDIFIKILNFKHFVGERDEFCKGILQEILEGMSKKGGGLLESLTTFICESCEILWAILNFDAKESRLYVFPTFSTKESFEKYSKNVRNGCVNEVSFIFDGGSQIWAKGSGKGVKCEIYYAWPSLVQLRDNSIISGFGGDHVKQKVLRKAMVCKNE